jgi:hypothetical protein
MFDLNSSMRASLASRVDQQHYLRRLKGLRHREVALGDGHPIMDGDFFGLPCDGADRYVAFGDR